MARHSRPRFGLGRMILWAAACLPAALAADILQTSGFASCGRNADVKVQRVDIKYNNDNKTVTFDVAGTSTRVQNVTAVLNVTAYGNQVYTNSFDPCSPLTLVPQLCPVPAGTFGARGSQAIPPQFADLVPAIAFQIPDIAAQATLELRSKDTGQNVACIQSQVSNGKTVNVPAVPYVAAGLAGAALVLGGVSAVGAAVGGAASGAGSAGGMGTISPSFVEVIGWFQGMAMNGMLSVNYPQVYRSFSKNFAFSTGLVPWDAALRSIDGFRERTGGNLTQSSVDVLRRSTLVFDDGSVVRNTTAKVKRAFELFSALTARQIETSINGTASGGSGENPPDVTRTVHGIQAFVEQASVPSADTFMMVLLVVSIVIAVIAVSILLVKVVLEIWALFGNFPPKLAGFRKHYWGSIARAITTLILLLYGIWVLYCMFQFTQGDSWAAKALAGVTLGLFTLILAFFSWKIWSTARKLKQTEGDSSALYDNKSIWVKYSLFYDSYRKQYWWIFVPTIIYMFVKGVALAVGDGHGMAQTIAQLVIEGVMLVVLLWSRPFERKSGNVINICIQVVRVLSVVCILVFVEQFAVAQTTQTIAGVVLIAVQGGLTAILAILIAWNAIIACCKQNPHRKRRKELEKGRDEDALTPLHARNSLLRSKAGQSETLSFANTGLSDPLPPVSSRDASSEKYGTSPSPPSSYADPYRPGTTSTYRPVTPEGKPSDYLMSNAAPLGRSDGRQPTLPNLGGYGYAPGTGLAPAPLRTPGLNPGYGGYGGGPPPPQRTMNFSTPYRGSPGGY